MSCDVMRCHVMSEMSRDVVMSCDIMNMLWCRDVRRCRDVC